MITVTLIAAIFSLVLTLVVIWANPYRFSNQAFALVLLVQTAWLGCVYRAMQIGAVLTLKNSADLEWWFRANGVVLSFLPTAVWLLKCAITANKHQRRKAIYASLPMFLLSLASIGVCWTQSFVWRDASGFLHRDTAYYMVILVGLLVYGVFVYEAFRKMRVHNGIRRVELQFLALNAGGAALLHVSLNALGNFLNIRTFNRLSILLVFAATALTAGALLMHRVFNAREVFLQLAQRLWFVLILSSGTYGLWISTRDLFVEPFGLLFSIAAFSPIAVWLDKRSRRWFDITGEKKIAQLRHCAIEIEKAAPNAAQMLNGFEELLISKTQAASVFFLFNNGPVHGQGGVIFAKDRTGFSTLCELEWATPESLDRRRSTAGTKDLKMYLEENSLGVIVPVPRGSPDPSLLLALGTRADERPYTFPEIERIMNLAELIDSILSRSKLNAQAASHARVECLSLMSRGLAHDLRNLITPISTFLVHTKSSYPPKSVEADVHFAAANAIQTITDYVRNTLSFPDRLEPSLESVAIDELFRDVRTLMLARAEDRGVRVAAAVSKVKTVVCDRVLTQRMIGNLVSNAIDASVKGQTILIAASEIGMGWTRLEVQDSGCGIPSEYINRVFDPYFTTKNRGQEKRGFGLGLTIAHNIALLHRGLINIASQPGKTVVTVDLPGAMATALSSAT